MKRPVSEYLDRIEYCYREGLEYSLAEALQDFERDYGTPEYMIDLTEEWDYDRWVDEERRHKYD